MMMPVAQKTQMTKYPISISDLVNAFRKIGIEDSMNLMVHSSLSQIGWVIGGAQSVVRALIESIGENGTLVMPSATPNCLHPEDWEPPATPDWIPRIVDHLPVFDMDTTPTSMGAIPEAFRTWPNTLRSNHPINSVCARGKIAREIVQQHNLEFSEGRNTPYEKVYENAFKVFLLGVGFDRCTMLHFAEFRSKHKRTTTSRFPMAKDGSREWISVPDMGNDNGTHFPGIGQLYMRQHGISAQKVAHADAILVDVKSLVDFGTAYFNNLDKNTAA